MAQATKKKPAAKRSSTRQPRDAQRHSTDAVRDYTASLADIQHRLQQGYVESAQQCVDKLGMKELAARHQQASEALAQEVGAALRSQDAGRYAEALQASANLSQESGAAAQAQYEDVVRSHYEDVQRIYSEALKEAQDATVKYLLGLSRACAKAKVV